VSDENTDDITAQQLPPRGQVEAQTETLEPGQTPQMKQDDESGSRWTAALREIASGSALMSVLAVVLAMVVGAVLIALTDENVHAASGRSPRR
jgi:simple sugar transport system permease protein